MIKYGTKFLPDVGKCLKDEKGIYRLSSKNSNVVEVEININNISNPHGNVFVIDNKFEVKLKDCTKKTLIGNLFSNDDQIAIMLNYQNHKTTENKEIYNLMQGWRDWFSSLIKLMRNEK